MKKNILFYIVFTCFFAVYTGGGQLCAQDFKEEAVPVEVTIDDDDDDYVTTIRPKKNVEKVENYAAQNIERRDFDKNEWEKLRKELDYRKPEDVKKAEEEAERRRKEQLKRENQTEPNYKPPVNFADWSGVAEVFKWVFITAFVFLFVFLIIRLMNEGNIFGPKNRKIGKSEIIDLEHIEENLDKIDDLDPVIRQAINQGNYRLAVRLYYLAILKNLSQKNAIVWKRDKTNRSYVQEMQSNPLFSDFRSTTRTFERIWYSAAKFERADFEQVQSIFDTLLRKTK